MDLARTILTEDVTRMRTNLTEHKLREITLDGFMLLPAVVIPDAYSAASDSKTLARDTEGLATPKRHHATE